MNKSEKRAQTFLYMGVLLTLIAADWHWYLGEFPEESFVAGLPVMKVVYVLWIAAIVICLAASAVFFWKLRKQEAAYTARISTDARISGEHKTEALRENSTL